jgi:glyceraldehyde 3-phosphate dehydrogenase
MHLGGLVPARRAPHHPARVSHLDGQLVDLVLRDPHHPHTPEVQPNRHRDVTVDEVNEAFRAAATDGPLAGVLGYSEAPIVSSDVVGSPASCIFDAPLTLVMGNLVKVLG